MTFVLDTNTISFLMRGNPAVVRQLVKRARGEVVLPQAAVCEIEYGLSRLPRSARQRKLRETFDGILAELGRAEWTDSVSRAFGEIKAGLERRGSRLEDFDLAVAAHALAVRATLVTSDTSDMERIPGLKLENWLDD